MLIFPESRKKILITGGAGFIGGAFIRHLLIKTKMKIYCLDKMGYASDLTSVKKTISFLGDKSEDRFTFINSNIANKLDLEKAMDISDPDIVVHLAAESHVDRSISNPSTFVESNIVGTFNLLQSLLTHWENLPKERRNNFRIIHISTDEVFGSLGQSGYFDETSSYDPRSPYSASKASADHLVKAWFHTYDLPVIVTNCSNNFGPWQFPEKLIPMVVIKASTNQNIPIYGDGRNIRDWLYVEDHVDALQTIINKGKIGDSYCIGSQNEKSNKQIVQLICNILDKEIPSSSPYSKLISYVKDRPGHDRRYAIKPTKIVNEIGWRPTHGFNEALEGTVKWYLTNINWYSSVMQNSNYKGERIGLRN